MTGQGSADQAKWISPLFPVTVQRLPTRKLQPGSSRRYDPAMRGDADHAFTWLDTAIEVHDGGLGVVPFDPLVARLHGDRGSFAQTPKSQLLIGVSLDPAALLSRSSRLTACPAMP